MESIVDRKSCPRCSWSSPAFASDNSVKIAVLYTTYLELPSNDWYMTWIDPFNQSPFGPSPNSEIARKMAACASPGLYFEVSPSQGIAAAMNALFAKAIADARIAG